MRWLLRNVIRDLKHEARRRRNPGKVCRRPIIGGKPLPPNGTRFLRLHDFTAKLLDEIDENQEAGNVQLLMVGREGGEQNIDELREQLGFKIVPKGFAPAPKEKDLLQPGMKVDGTPITDEDMKKWGLEDDGGGGLPDVTAEEILAEEEGEGAPSYEEGDMSPELADIEAVEDKIDNMPEDDEAPLDPDDLLDDDEEWVDDDAPYTESELMGHNKDDLILIHKKVCPDSGSTGKTKQKLTDEILDAQAGA